MKLMKTKKYIIFFLFSSLFLFLSQSKQLIIFKTFEFPKERIINIPELKSTNAIFKEFCYEVEENYKKSTTNKQIDVLFFQNKVQDNQTLFELASRCNITYDTIATLNLLENVTESIKGKNIIIPTATGLFIYKEKTDNSLQIILREEYFNQISDSTPVYIIDGKEFFFLQNAKFSPTQRSYFLDATLRLPIDKDKFWISSDFGRRKQPITGEFKNHNGIDLAAQVGTPVYAIKDAVVTDCVQNDSIFGNYLILSHDNGKFTSVYAHLSKTVATKNQKVKKGELIGYVGQTGMATGPHLHFEIRQGGKALDPETKLRLK